MSTKSKDWANQIDQYIYHKNKKGAGVAGDPASDGDLESFFNHFKFPKVAEFVDFYRCVNGFGVNHDNDLFWQVSPLEDIPKVIEEGREMFSETHPEIAARFYPFIDTGWRAYIGYMLSESGETLPGLYYFDPDNYEYDETQDWEDFLEMSYPDLYYYVRYCVIFS